MSSYGRDSYYATPTRTNGNMPSQTYPVDRQVQPLPQAVRPQPQQYYSLPNMPPAQQYPYAGPQYAPYAAPQQPVRSSHPTTPMGNGYAVGEAYPAQPYRPDYPRTSSQRSTRSYDDGERRSHKKHHHRHRYTEARPTLGDSVYAMFKTLFSNKR